VAQLGHQAQQDVIRHEAVGDADELGDAAVEAAHPRQHFAQVVVEEALHRGQQQAGRRGHGFTRR